MNGTGPEGYGHMTGRGMGRCGGVALSGGPGNGRGMRRGFVRGPGAGNGLGWGMGPGRRPGWFAAGYQDNNERTADANIRSALETRVTALRAELIRTEDLLKASSTEADSSNGSGT